MTGGTAKHQEQSLRAQHRGREGVLNSKHETREGILSSALFLFGSDLGLEFREEGKKSSE